MTAETPSAAADMGAYVAECFFAYEAVRDARDEALTRAQELEDERDQARAIAVELEQELAHVREVAASAARFLATTPHDVLARELAYVSGSAS